MCCLSAHSGLEVFPYRPRSKEPLTKNGFLNATRDEKEIRRWWTTWPDANVGLPTGEANELIVVDPDSEKGEKFLALVEEKPRQVSADQRKQDGQRPAPGFLSCPRDAGRCLPRRQGREDEGLDIKADGGYIIAPPSIHPNGKTYEWDEKSPHEFARPQWLLDLARDRKSVLKALDGPTPAEGASGARR